MNPAAAAARAAEKLFEKRESSQAHCLCGKVRFEIDVPAFWAWHDHSLASRRAHGAVYATYVGSWRKRLRMLQGERNIRRFRDDEAGTTRSFCGRCGTPLFYERDRSPHMVNIPRGLSICAAPIAAYISFDFVKSPFTAVNPMPSNCAAS